MPRISALPSATSAQVTDQFPVVQGAVTKRLTFATAQASGLFLPADNTISTNKLIDDAVTADKLQADVSVNANRAVTSNHIQDSAVITDKINNLNVTTPKLADGVITNIKLGADSLSIAKFNLADRTAIANASSARVGGRVLTNGFVKNVVVFNSGSGYVPATPPAVTISAPTTAGGLIATATAIVSGTAVTSIVLTSEGSGYTSDPTVTIAPPSSGTTAKAVAYAIPNGLATSDTMAVSSGTQHGSIIMTSDRKLKSFGYQNTGALGLAAWNGVASLPQEVFLYTGSNSPPLPVKWYFSGSTSFIIDEFGAVWSTGYGGYGQLGLNTTGNSFVFQQIPSTFFQNKPIVKLATSPGSYSNASSIFALAADGSVFAWGYNGYGQLGIGNTTQQNAPVLVPGTGTSYIISDIATGGNVTSSTGIVAMIVSNVNNQVLVAGYNGHGALANGSTSNNSNLGYWTSASGPVQNAKNLHICGDYPSLAVSTTSGELWTAGYNGHGELGNGTTTSTNAGRATRIISSGVNRIDGVGGYYGSRVALMNDGTIRVFGYNGYGQLGNGTTTNNPNPTDTFSATAAGRTVVKVACNCWDYQTTALLLSDGSIFCAGYDGYSKQGRQDGQSLGSRTSWGKFLLTRSDIVDLRWNGYNQYSHIEILTTDGKIYSVGYNGNGDLCRGDTTDRYGISNYLL
jgi:alpha-tubulin suppressor-like RCC1 family protein